MADCEVIHLGHGSGQVQCTRCLLHLKYSDFYINRRHKSGRNHWCKKCEKKHAAEAWIKQSKEQWNYLSGRRCIWCGETNPLFLEFDHIRDKHFNLGRQRGSQKKIDLEREKCQILCQNCHKIKTVKERGGIKWELYQEWLLSKNDKSIEQFAQPTKSKQLEFLDFASRPAVPGPSSDFPIPLAI